MGKGQEFSIDSTPLFIGRGEDVAIRRNNEGLRLELPDQSRSISRKHAKIVIQGGKYQIMDTSVNGTILNGKKVSYGDLQNNSTIEVGINEGIVMLEFILPPKKEEFSVSRPEPQPKPQTMTPSQENPFLEFTNMIPHFRQKESSESYSASSSVSWKWFAVITVGILVIFLLILFIF